MKAVPPLVAVIDDEEPVRIALARLLRIHGLRVATFGSGESFLLGLADCDPGCALLDLQMPGLTGFDVLKRLNPGSGGLPVVIMTAHDEPGLQETCMLRGAAAYLLKPLDGEALVQAISSALARKGSNQGVATVSDESP